MMGGLECLAISGPKQVGAARKAQRAQRAQMASRKFSRWQSFPTFEEDGGATFLPCSGLWLGL